MVVCFSVGQFCKICNIKKESRAARLCETILTNEGRGLVVVFIGGRMAFFLPLVNPSYENKWHSSVIIENNLSPRKYLENVSQEAGYIFSDEDVYFPELKHWRANGNLVRADNKLPRNVWQLEPYLEKLNLNANVNCIVFLNTRDFPQIEYGIGNMCWPRAENGANWLIPTWDDITPQKKIKIPHWNERPPIAIWRGSSTGDGRRLQLVKMSRSDKLDAQLTRWNIRPRLLHNVLTYCRRDPTITCAPCLSIEEQSKRAKYVIHIDGNVAAFRLCSLFAAEFTVLFVESPWYLWYQDKLEPWRHFVPVAADLSDLFDKITWCQTHDEEARAIAKAGRAFYELYLTPDHVAQFWRQQILKYGIPLQPC